MALRISRTEPRAAPASSYASSLRSRRRTRALRPTPSCAAPAPRATRTALAKTRSAQVRLAIGRRACKTGSPTGPSLGEEELERSARRRKQIRTATTFAQ